MSAIGEAINDKKIVIGVIDHHTLQVERPDQVADLIREALKHVPPERLIISSELYLGRFADGRFTKKSVRDYLTILSVFRHVSIRAKRS